MVQLVSLAEVRAALRIDADDDLALELAIDSAGDAVVNYLKAGANGFIASGNLIPEKEVPAPVKMATIILVGILRRNPDNDVEGAFEPGFLPRPVTALLYPLRDPALA